MDGKLKSKWVKALRSGNYKQTKGKLKSRNGGFCCIGVICDILGRRWEWKDGDYVGNNIIVNEETKDFAGDIWGDVLQPLVQMNDDGKSFSEIADYIEECL